MSLDTLDSKHPRGCGFWGATGCLGFALVGAIGIWWLKGFITDHLTLDPAEAAIIAEQVIDLNLPEDFAYQQAFATDDSKIAWATEDGAEPTSPIIMVIWDAKGEVDKNNVLAGFEKNRTQGEEATFLGRIEIEYHGEAAELAESEYEDGRKEYTFIQAGDPGILMVVFAGPASIVTAEWVDGILNYEQ